MNKTIVLKHHHSLIRRLTQHDYLIQILMINCGNEEVKYR